jgi:hypothetical protein
MKLSHYQNITGDPEEDPRRKDSAFWNQGKWDNFIEPLLPTENREDMTFVDIGANNGLFCKLAKDSDFREVYGYEADKGAVERGNAWKDKKGYEYNLRHRVVGKTFSFDEVPLADLTLLSNVHYYFDLKDWLKLLDELYWKTEYCLIITRPFRERKDERPLTDIDSIKHYFRDWELVRARYRVRQKHMEKKGDPKPRVLHSMLFRSRLRRKKFEDLIPGAKADPIKINRPGLLADIFYGTPMEEMDYYKAWKDRMYPKKWDKRQLEDFVQSKLDLVSDILKNGVKEPVLISGDHKTIDGKHRIAILDELGYGSVICRLI